MRRLSLIVAALVVAACGTKGPLTLPPKPQSAAAPKTPAPQPAATAPAGDATVPAPADDSNKPAPGTAR